MSRKIQLKMRRRNLDFRKKVSKCSGETFKNELIMDYFSQEKNELTFKFSVENTFNIIKIKIILDIK